MKEARRLGRLAKGLMALATAGVLGLAFALAIVGQGLAFDHRVQALLAETATCCSIDGAAWNAEHAGVFRDAETGMRLEETWFGVLLDKDRTHSWLASFLPEDRRVLVDPGAPGGSRILSLEPVLIFTGGGVALVESGRVFHYGLQGWSPGGTLSEVKARVLLIRELRRVFDLARTRGRLDLLELFLRSPCWDVVRDAAQALGERGDPALPIFRRFLEDEKLAQFHFVVLHQMRFFMECPGLGPELVHMLDRELSAVERSAPYLRGWRLRYGTTELILYSLARIRCRDCREPLSRLRDLLETIQDYDETRIREGVAELERALETP
ncbi:MAG TPA: hypothetical protein VFF73_21885 [Planctomycetota bacterium]|nr:hypothetical protein [Planctomycetota bacterium]